MKIDIQVNMPLYGTVKCQGTVRLAHSTTQHSSTAIDRFLSLKKQMLRFFSTVRTCKGGKYGIFKANYACNLDRFSFFVPTKIMLFVLVLYI